MCVIFFAYQVHHDYPFILLANRDEYYQRPTLQADYWRDHRNLLAGKDLKAGGTWLGITKEGRYSAITNIRSRKNIDGNAPSRGNLVKDYLLSDQPPETYLRQIDGNYNGFNQLVGDRDQLYYYNNQDQVPVTVKPGVYGVSNAHLNTPWPKVSKGIKQLGIWSSSIKELPRKKMLNFMTDPTVSPDDQLPDTGFGIELERLLSSIFIRGEQYGTRCTTLLSIRIDGEVNFIERGYGAQGQRESEQHFNFTIDNHD